MEIPALNMITPNVYSLQQNKEDERRRKEQMSFKHIYGEEKEQLTVTQAVRYLYKTYGNPPKKKEAQELIQQQWYVTQWQLDEIYYKWIQFCSR